MELMFQDYFDEEEDDNLDEDTDNPNYENSGPLDIHLITSSERVVAVAKELASEIGYTLDRGVSIMTLVLLNLYKSYLLDAERWIGYSRNHNYYELVFRYNRQRVTCKPLLKVIDKLAANEYIEHEIGKQGKAPGKGRCSRMRATEKLVEVFCQYAFSPDDIESDRHKEVIIKKDKDKKPIEYAASNREANRMRKVVQTYVGGFVEIQ